VGSRDEDPKYAGISHFLEHMVFKGSQKRPSAAAIAKEADRIGAEYNAFTGKEYTCFYIQTTVENFDLGLDIVGDMVTKPLIKNAELKKESGTIIEELKMYNDNPMINVYGKTEETLFGTTTPMGREIVGTSKTVNSINAVIMRAYFEKYYVGENATLVIAGNLPPDYLVKVKKYLDRLPKGIRNDRIADSQYQNKVRLLHKDTEQAHFGIGIPGYAISEEDKYAAEVIATALGGYMSARLFTEIREKRGWAYRIFSFCETNSDTGYLGIIGGIKKDKIEEAISITQKEIEKFRNGFKSEEIERAKSHLAGYYTLKYESPDERSKFMVLQYLLSRRPETPEQFLNKIKSVTASDIRRVGKTLLSGDNLALTIIGPYKNKEKFAKILAQGKKE
jgi:predicted Zn-dependent peptidase